MASGFIILKDGRCFARRWTAYDEIIRMVITELERLEDGQDLANWLRLRIPEATDEHTADAGWGFHNTSLDTWINRTLDLRSLTSENQVLFWKALQSAKTAFDHQGKAYSAIAPDLFSRFFEMYSLAEQGKPPMELTDWNKLADPCTEQNGPGWKKPENPS